MNVKKTLTRDARFEGALLRGWYGFFVANLAGQLTTKSLPGWRVSRI